MTPTTQNREATSRERVKAGLFFVTFVGGGLLGAALAYWRAPDSGLVAGLSVLMLPLALIGSYILWLGTLFIRGLLKLIFWMGTLLFKGILGGRSGRASAGASRSDGSPPRADGEEELLREMRRKAFLLVPAPLFMGGLVGLPAAIIGPGSFLVTWMLYAGIGLAYGLALRALARADKLPYDFEIIIE